MTAAIVLLALLLVLVLIGSLRLGAQVEYSDEGVKVWLRICGIPRQLYPKPPRSKKPGGKEKQKKPKQAKEKKSEPASRRGGSVALVRQLLPVIGQALGALKRRIRVDHLTFHYVAAGEDAAQTALSYGRVSGGAGMLLALLHQQVRVKRQQVSVEVDFLADQATVYLNGQVSLTVGQILYLAVRYGLACLRRYLRQKKQTEQKKTAEQPSGSPKAGDEKEKGGVS